RSRPPRHSLPRAPQARPCPPRPPIGAVPAEGRYPLPRSLFPAGTDRPSRAGPVHSNVRAGGSAVSHARRIASAEDAVRERELIDICPELPVARRDVRLVVSVPVRRCGVDPLPGAVLLLLDRDRDE